MQAESVWKEVTSDISGDIADSWWAKIVKQYSDDERVTHDMDYLKETFERFESVKKELECPNAVALALIFLYYDYDPKAMDCTDKNVEHFKEFASDAGIPDESPLRTKVLHLMEAASTHSTEEHKTDGAFGNEDRHYFLDLDIADLGSAPEKYSVYVAKIKKEYAFLPESMYKSLRIKVLESLLQIPNIYATREFREKYENQARRNVEDEVKSLKT
ncbi:hypothetical protein R5R35_002625 [Gryllus longicercus]|uniref:Uncharacterized protein n=1 Tax=Gryllus longicercus TaxID=2509291 RepID=A0AAN9V6D6_9ORTH